MHIEINKITQAWRTWSWHYINYWINLKQHGLKYNLHPPFFFFFFSNWVCLSKHPEHVAFLQRYSAALWLSLRFAAHIYGKLLPKTRGVFRSRPAELNAFSLQQSRVHLEPDWNGHAKRDLCSVTCVNEQFHSADLIHCISLHVQDWWRSCQANQRDEQLKYDDNVRQGAAICIQSAWRGFQERRRFLIWKEAVLVIQRNWRLCHYRRYSQAAVTIQAAWRSYKAREQYIHHRHIIVLFQAGCRGYLARQR